MSTTPEERKEGSATSLRSGRPHITLTIPPPGLATPRSAPNSTLYIAGTPITPVAQEAPPGTVPFNIFHAYPSKASEFVFKQFEGFRDFTKSGLSVGEKASFWIYGKVASLSRKWFTHCFLFFVVAGYSLLGGLAFHYIEGRAEAKHVADIYRNRNEVLLQIRQNFRDLSPMEDEADENLWMGQSSKALREYEAVLKEYFKIDSNILAKGDKPDWDYWSSVFYCGTIYTTIGYGHIAPSTTTGRALTIVYAIIGIPMFLILLADFGKMFTRGIKWVWAFVRRLYYTGSCKKVRKTAPVQEVMKGVQVMYDIATFRRPSQTEGGCGEPADVGAVGGGDGTPHSPTSGEPPSTPAPSNFAIDDEFNIPITVAITILLAYILCGACVFYIWERTWSFFESFYFVFISMSTIGFGDFVPQNKMYMMASIVYLAFGLALTTMCINVVQEKLSDTFRQATAKIGATIGLKVSEEDGSVTPATPANVELAQIHKSPSQS